MISLLNADTLRNPDGTFVKGHRASPSTEFKKGQHWRKQKPHWDRSWLWMAYIVRQLSASEIAQECNCTENNVYYWLGKHDIPRRTISEARQVKYWGVSGEDNPMYGRTGEDSPSWKGGITPERQSFYATDEWKFVSSLVWKRDKGLCQRCKQDGDHIHHIVSFEVRELRADIDNLILLCASCHHWVHSKENINNDFIG